MKHSIVLFDLDGTLTDSGIGVGNGVQYALRQMGFEEAAPELLRRYLGPPLWTSFKDFAGMDTEQTAEAVKLYREYYNETGAYENAVFDGIPELLVQLKDAGARLAVATSKVDHSAHAIANHFDLAKYFDVIAGSDEDGSQRGTKALVIAHALAQLEASVGEFTAADVVMIGDREHDVFGAAGHGIAAIGVTWGYAEPGELEAAGAIKIVETVADLGRALMAAH